MVLDITGCYTFLQRLDNSREKLEATFNEIWHEYYRHEDPLRSAYNKAAIHARETHDVVLSNIECDSTEHEKVYNAFEKAQEAAYNIFEEKIIPYKNERDEKLLTAVMDFKETVRQLTKIHFEFKDIEE